MAKMEIQFYLYAVCVKTIMKERLNQMAKISEFIKYLKNEVNLGSIYVLGAQGQTIPDILPKIPSMESTSRVTEILTKISEEIKSGIDITKAHAFDCSGLAMYYFIVMLLTKYDLTAKQMYNDLCKVKPSRDSLIPGDAVFNEDLSHVGYYIGGNKVVEAKGRKYGVCITDLSSYNWAKYGRFNWWENEEFTISRKLQYTEGKSLMTGDDVEAVQAKLNYLGYASGPTDGKFGKKTKAAVEKFQKEHFSTVKYPGVVTEKTAKALGFKWK